MTMAIYISNMEEERNIFSGSSRFYFFNVFFKFSIDVFIFGLSDKQYLLNRKIIYPATALSLIDLKPSFIDRI